MQSNSDAIELIWRWHRSPDFAFFHMQTFFKTENSMVSSVALQACVKNLILYRNLNGKSWCNTELIEVTGETRKVIRSSSEQNLFQRRGQFQWYGYNGKKLFLKYALTGDVPVSRICWDNPVLYKICKRLNKTGEFTLVSLSGLLLQFN